ncbi:MAG: hypothetical protein AB1765_05575 [Candidatus Hydrogenedentota bacterium]
MKKVIILFLIALIPAAIFIYLFYNELQGLYTIYKIYTNKNTIIKLGNMKHILPSEIDLKLLIMGKIDKDEFIEKIVKKFPQRGSIKKLACDLPDNLKQRCILESLKRGNTYLKFIKLILPRYYENEIIKDLENIKGYITKKNGLDKIYETLPPLVMIEFIYKYIPEKHRKSIASSEEYKDLLMKLPDKIFLKEAGDLLLQIS